MERYDHLNKLTENGFNVCISFLINKKYKILIGNISFTLLYFIFERSFILKEKKWETKKERKNGERG